MCQINAKCVKSRSTKCVKSINAIKNVAKLRDPQNVKMSHAKCENNEIIKT